MDILVISDEPNSEVLKRSGVDSRNALPFSLPPFDVSYTEPNTDVPECVKLLKHRLMECDAVVVHVLPGQKLSNLIAWGKLHDSSWAGLQSATVIREDCEFLSEDQMNGRLADLLDEEQDAQVS